MRQTKQTGLIIIISLLLLLTGCGGAPAATETAPPAAETAEESPETPPEASFDPAEIRRPGRTSRSVGTAFPGRPSVVGAPVQDAPPPWTGPDLPEQPRAGDDFFADAVFLGNSLIQGLDMFGGLETADFIGVTSANVISAAATRNCFLQNGTPATQAEVLCQKQYGKIYVLFGINEITFDTDYFIELYSDLLDAIEAREPEAEIYIMSLTPLTESKSNDDSVFTRERVLEYNEALYALAEARQAWYVDDIAALSGPDGWLPAEESTDGVHLTAEKYPDWAEYLRTHYYNS